MKWSEVIENLLNQPCRACGNTFHEIENQWAIVWDGEKWCMIRWVLTMPLGPYHGGSCIGPELSSRNKDKRRYLQECIDGLKEDREQGEP